MKAKLKQWVRLPTGWIESGGLAAFRWKKDEGAAGIAALMVLPVIAHHAGEAQGTATLTYDALGHATGLSRTSLARGLDRLEQQEIISREEKRSRYSLRGFDPDRGWAKLPASGLYTDGGAIGAFSDFHLRRVAELDALKAYLAIVARRDRKANYAYLTYPKLEVYAGIHRGRIKAALSLLIKHGLVVTQIVPSRASEHGTAISYRLTHLDSYVHTGTQGQDVLPVLDEALDDLL